MKTKAPIPTLVVALLLGLGAGNSHANEPLYHFEAEVAGIMCSVCSEKIQRAFSAVEKVTEVKVKTSGKPGVGRVLMTRETAALTKEELSAALRDDAKSYHVLSVKEVQP